MEDTHLTDIESIEKLVAFVIVAFSWVYVVCDYLTVTSNKIKKHGKRARSIFKKWA